ncbi:MAG: NAD(P)H-dependent glycerol-3-phosphate dehydrogenase [Myxococcota bacterium]|nr:NAD(P)H-dependent glycerol-3-phosphate dehydrogenase [Myxococcota bacterium]
MQSTVMGSGSFGTALAMQLARCGHSVRLWDRKPERAASTQRERVNRRYLPDHRLPDGVTVTSDAGWALEGAELVVLAIPSQQLREALGAMRPQLPDDAILCCAAKGIEEGTLLTMDEVMAQVLESDRRSCVISGPSFAAEVAKDMPTAVTVAGADPAATQKVADAFHGSSFRVYHSHDVVGVEIGGSIKNVMAIATGMADGMGLGLNTRAALITRGLAEITRLGAAKGADPMTFAGLAGMGDLVLTCTGNLSRNRRVGLALGRGQTLEQVLEELGQVAEGVVTTRSARALGQKLGVELPITEQVYRILYEGLDPQRAMAALLGRARKHEQA